MYKTSEIINRFMFKEFQEIPTGQLWEFVGPIITQMDHEILKTWMKYFKSVKVPFIIVRRKALNSHRNVPTTFNIKWLICQRKV